jgi:hypothetical protein
VHGLSHQVANRDGLEFTSSSGRACQLLNSQDSTIQVRPPDPTLPEAWHMMGGATLSIGPRESIATSDHFVELGSIGRVHIARSSENHGSVKASVAATGPTMSRGLFLISEFMWSVKIIHKFIAFLGLLVNWLRFAKSAEISVLAVHEVHPHSLPRPAHSLLPFALRASFGRLAIPADVTVIVRKSRSRCLKVCVAKHLPISDARGLLYTIVLGRTTVT